jgi:magnesium-transporting ATPase (P-type)
MIVKNKIETLLFLEIAKQCQGVIVCRASPSQKAAVV